MWKILYILFCIKMDFYLRRLLSVSFSKIKTLSTTKLCVQNLCSSNSAGGWFFGGWAESLSHCLCLLAFHSVKIPRARKITAMTEK